MDLGPSNMTPAGMLEDLCSLQDLGVQAQNLRESCPGASFSPCCFTTLPAFSESQRRIASPDVTTVLKKGLEEEDSLKKRRKYLTLGLGQESLQAVLDWPSVVNPHAPTHTVGS